MYRAPLSIPVRSVSLMLLPASKSATFGRMRSLRQNSLNSAYFARPDLVPDINSGMQTSHSHPALRLYGLGADSQTMGECKTPDALILGMHVFSGSHRDI